MNCIFRCFNSGRNITVFVGSWIVWWIFQFIMTYDENVEKLNVVYQQHSDILKDCSNILQSTEFMQKCKESTTYVSKSLLHRAFKKTFSDLGFCGTETCWAYIFGPNFTWQGIIFQMTFLILITWILYIIMFKSWKMVSNKRRKLVQPEIMLIRDNRYNTQSQIPIEAGHQHVYIPDNS